MSAQLGNLFKRLPEELLVLIIDELGPAEPFKETELPSRAYRKEQVPAPVPIVAFY